MEQLDSGRFGGGPIGKRTWRSMDNQQYAERDPMLLDKMGNHYTRHVEAMTAEGLHNKADIAAELAFRDWRIQHLEAHIKGLSDALGEASGVNQIAYECGGRDWPQVAERLANLLKLAVENSAYDGPFEREASKALAEYERIKS